MKLSNLPFFLNLAKGIEGAATFICGSLKNDSENNENLYITDAWLNNVKDLLGTTLGNLTKESDNSTKELVDGFSTIVDLICRNDNLFLDKNNPIVNRQGKKCYILKDRCIFEKDNIYGIFENLANKIDEYLNKNKLNYTLHSQDFTTNLELEVSLMLDHNRSFLHFVNIGASEVSGIVLEASKNFMGNFISNLNEINERQRVKYLVKNDKLQLLVCKEERRINYLTVDKKEYISRFRNVPSTEDKDDVCVAIVDNKNLTDWHFGKEKKDEQIKNEEVEKEPITKVKEIKKSPVEKKQIKKRNFNIFKGLKKVFSSIFGGFKSLLKGIKKECINILDSALDACGDLTVGDLFLKIIPALAMITYVILLVTGVMNQITFSSSSFDGTLFGYNFEISGLMAEWLENTDHGFFSAITLGLIQIILIVVGFVADLILHLLFLVLSIIFFILIIIFAMCFYYVFPVALAILSIITFFKENDKKTLAGVCMIISIICCVSYFLIGMNVL